MKRVKALRYVAIVALLPVVAAMFWVTALVASNVAGLVILGVNVHSLGLASYAGDMGPRPAPLSLRILQDAGQETGAVSGSPGPGSPNAVPAASAQPGPSHGPTTTPTPMPSPSPSPLPLPTPTTLPLPTPTPSLLPLPVTSIVPLPPILPSVVPGLVK